MTQKEFDDHLEWRLNEIQNVLGVKAKEYVRNDNPLHNFEVGAEMTGDSPAKVLDGFLLKHIISYRDMLNDLDEGKVPDAEKVQEKFGDIINYFILQEGLMYDLINKDVQLKERD